MDLRTYSDHFPTQNYLVGYYNRQGVCFLRGTSKYKVQSSLQRLMNIITIPNNRPTELEVLTAEVMKVQVLRIYDAVLTHK